MPAPQTHTHNNKLFHQPTAEEPVSRESENQIYRPLIRIRGRGSAVVIRGGSFVIGNLAHHLSATADKERKIYLCMELNGIRNWIIFSKIFLFLFLRNEGVDDVIIGMNNDYQISIIINDNRRDITRAVIYMQMHFSRT